MAYFEVKSKPRLTFPTLTGSIVTFNSQYAGLPLKSHVVDVDYTGSAISGVNVTHSGKNLLDNSLLLDQLGWNRFTIKLEPNTSYVMSSNITVAKTDELPLYVFHTGGNPGSTTLVYDEHPVIVTTLSDGIITIQQRRASGTDSFQNYENQLELGSMPTYYEPYNAQSFNITFDTPIYGGSYDCLTGIVTSNKDIGGGDITPTYQQTATANCETNLGVNNIWADTGDTTLQYPKFG